MTESEIDALALSVAAELRAERLRVPEPPSSRPDSMRMSEPEEETESFES